MSMEVTSRDLEALEKRLEDYKEHTKEILAEKDKAVNTALASAKEAVAVAETNSEKWRANANEWRATVNDLVQTFMPRQEFITWKENLKKDTHEWWWVVFGIIGILFGLYNALR